MKAKLPLFVFIDACGWELIKNDPFLRQLAPHRQRLTSVLGYSSACVPSILSGRWPSEHRNWSYFVYDPQRSPFKSLRWLRWLPETLTSRRRFRRWLSRFVKRQMNFRGYFDLYNVPFRHISLFDFTERKNPLQPDGLNRGPNIFDHLHTRGIRYHVSAPERSEEANLATLLRDIQSERIDFAFLYWPGLDALMHSVGNAAPQVGVKLRQYEEWLARLCASAQKHYAAVRLYVFSDHGMANCEELLDLRSRVDSLPVRMGHDYAVVYDSTMARFWFFNEQARSEITACLGRVPQGRVLPEAELRALGAWFPDHYFGEVIFLVKEGVLIVPSHMGERPIRAMHGYHPNEVHSFAALFTNQSVLPAQPEAIPELFQLMMSEAEASYLDNRTAASDLTLPVSPSAEGAMAVARSSRAVG
jgi:hypothetical protein